VKTIHLPVTAEHIADGWPESEDHSPAALALRAAFPAASHVLIESLSEDGGEATVFTPRRFLPGETERTVYLPPELCEMEYRFDREQPVEPGMFTVRREGWPGRYGSTVFAVVLNLASFAFVVHSTWFASMAAPLRALVAILTVSPLLFLLLPDRLIPDWLIPPED
jgi:hypothetical protein